MGVNGKIFAAAGLAVVCLSVPSSASAGTVFGADLSLAPDTGCGGCGIVGVTKSNGAPDTGSPVSGVLVSARIKTTGIAGTGFIRVLHPTAAALPTEAQTYRNDGQAPIAVTADAMPAGHVTEIPTQLRIQAGDHLGAAFPNQNVSYLHADFDAVCRARGESSDPLSHHAVGAGASYTPGCGPEVAVEPLLQGTVEADADGDGFGDETQDKCPTNASVQGACPVGAGAPTPVAKKCKKGRKLVKRKGKSKCVKRKRKK